MHNQSLNELKQIYSALCRKRITPLYVSMISSSYSNFEQCSLTGVSTLKLGGNDAFCVIGNVGETKF